MHLPKMACNWYCMVELWPVCGAYSQTDYDIEFLRYGNPPTHLDSRPWHAPLSESRVLDLPKAKGTRMMKLVFNS